MSHRQLYPEEIATILPRDLRRKLVVLGQMCEDARNGPMYAAQMRELNAYIVQLKREVPHLFRRDDSPPVAAAHDSVAT